MSRGGWNKGLKGWTNSGSFKKGHSYLATGRTLLKKGHTLNVGRKLGLMSKEHRIKISKANSGENSYRWKGGITDKNNKIRKNVEYRLWREAIFTRDNWTCQMCQKRGGQKIHADHIKPFSVFPELRFAIDNGRTLCEDCHKVKTRLDWKIYLRGGVDIWVA